MEFEALAQKTIFELRTARCFLAVMESCTGGMIAAALTDIAGASEVFWGGAVCYDNSAKEKIVGVPSELIYGHGAVSREVAASLAEQGLARMRDALATAHSSTTRNHARFLCLSTTGIAGPGGGTPEKPVGLCYIGLASSNGKSSPPAIEVRGEPGLLRSEYRELFARRALESLLLAI